MAFVFVWVMTVGIVFALGYSFGYQSGYQEGIHRGFQGALERAIQVERPLNLLRRILVPRKD